MSGLALAAERAEVPLLVAFIDIHGYAVQCARADDADIARIMDGYYRLVAARVAAGGGRVIKYIGDSALIAFEPTDADRATETLLAIKADVDQYLLDHGWDCRVVVKAHVGPVIAGPYGPDGDKRYDVLGRTVNAAAMLDSVGVTLSVEAFRSLSPELRQRFKKHTAPITYIRVEDPHRLRRR